MRQLSVQLSPPGAAAGPVPTKPNVALAAGASFCEAAQLANYAAGIVVMKYGTRPVFWDELAGAIS